MSVSPASLVSPAPSVAPVSPVSPALSLAVGAPARWRLGTRVAFRLCVIYFSLYVICTQMLPGMFPLPAVNLPEFGLIPPMRNITEWAASHVFRMSGPLASASTGSGDKAFDWVQAFCFLAIAGIATIVWSWVDRSHHRDIGVQKWFRLFLRFALGSTMVSYGMVKAIPLQMPAPGLTRLLEPFGHFSPMGVLWASIGASRGYEMCTGAAELTAGILLFVPGLTTLGSLVCLAVVTQIFILNMTYDVPVKLFSFHLILMSLLLLAPEIKRLAAVVILNRAAGPSTQPPLVRNPRAMRILIVAQLVFGAYLIGINAYGAVQSWTQRGGGAPKSPLYGIWTVDEMSIDGHTRAPLLTDGGRWRRVTFQIPTAMAFQRMDDTFDRYGAKIDTDAKSLTLSKPTDKSWSARFAFQRPTPERLLLDGTMDGHAVHMDLRLVDRSTIPLVNRGFHWIQETPFNR
jgi:uncharacterized membrane protein YphA (DoxX/SURF4 family)